MKRKLSNEQIQFAFIDQRKTRTEHYESLDGFHTEQFLSETHAHKQLRD